jgi:hypothetical protein
MIASRDIGLVVTVQFVTPEFLLRVTTYGCKSDNNQSCTTLKENPALTESRRFWARAEVKT